MSILSFRSLKLDDKERVDMYLKITESNSCQYCFANLFCLKEKYGTEICFYEENLYIRQINRINDGRVAYFVPLGRGNLEDCIENIVDTSKEQKHNVYFFAISLAEKEKLSSLKKYRFIIEEHKDWSEYLYNSVRMIDFSSPELSKKRRGVNQFWNLYGDKTVVENITDENINDVRDFQMRWMEVSYEKNQDKESLVKENIAIENALENYKELGLQGIVLKIENNIKGYAYGTMLPGGAFDIIAQKAEVKYRHIYKVIYQEHVKSYYENAEWTNMEEDIGIIGLRRIKNEYIPDLMLKKYTAYIN